jgi:cysteine sulfinate desulfinase/cysteine desulfurase-like protein
VPPLQTTARRRHLHQSGARPAAAQNLLRISCTAAHTEKHVDRLITTLVKVATELGIER